MKRALADSYRACHDVVRRSGSNFALAFWLLPREKRLAMDALYAFARHTDDLGDAGDACAEERAGRLVAWRRSLHAARAGETVHDALLPAIIDAERRYGMPAPLLDDLIDGVERDLTQTHYATWPELQSYCYQVAGTVGLACLHIWGFQQARALGLAETCGQAFQLTNILRDVKEDAARGRVYLPQEDLDRYGYCAGDLARGVADERFDGLMQCELERATRLYDAAAAMHDDLERDGRRVFRLMFGRYRAILDRIRRQPRDVLQRRITISLPSKLGIAGRMLLASKP